MNVHYLRYVLSENLNSLCQADLEMSSKRLAVVRHVYLRTQQRRLRHVTSVVFRNLSLSEVKIYPANNLSIAMYFTIHSQKRPNEVIYQSDPVRESYNPRWEAVEFNNDEFQQYSSLSVFIFKLWVRTIASPEAEKQEDDQGKNDKNEECCQVVLEKTVDLAELVYLGNFVNRDGTLYPLNSMLIGMFEGYYSYPSVGGVPCPPRVSHGLSDSLPPQSLLEVNKTEVCDSYYYVVVHRLLNRQEVLNRTTDSAKSSKQRVQNYLKVKRDYFDQRSEVERLRMRTALLKQRLLEQEKIEREERHKLSQLKDKLDSREDELRLGQSNLVDQKEKYGIDYLGHCKRSDMLVRAKRNQVLRQGAMVMELSYTFFIKETDGSHTICNVILPYSDQLDQLGSLEQLGVALGYVAHLIHHLSKILLVPLQYPIHPHGSRSSIFDNISDESIIDSIKEFPLYLKGSERALFQYAVYLLNKDIAQLRQHCGYGTSKSMLKKTLPNLKFLLYKLIKELPTKQQQLTRSLGFEHSLLFSSAPIDTASVSIASGSSSPKIPDTTRTSSTATTTSTPQSPAMEHEAYHNTHSPPISFLPRNEINARSLSPAVSGEEGISIADRQQLHHHDHVHLTHTNQSEPQDIQLNELQTFNTSETHTASDRPGTDISSDHSSSGHFDSRLQYPLLMHSNQLKTYPTLSPILSGDGSPSSSPSSLFQSTPEEMQKKNDVRSEIELQTPGHFQSSHFMNQAMEHADLHTAGTGLHNLVGDSAISSVSPIASINADVDDVVPPVFDAVNPAEHLSIDNMEMGSNNVMSGSMSTTGDRNSGKGQTVSGNMLLESTNRVHRSSPVLSGNRTNRRAVMRSRENGSSSRNNDGPVLFAHSDLSCIPRNGHQLNHQSSTNTPAQDSRFDGPSTGNEDKASPSFSRRFSKDTDASSYTNSIGDESEELSFRTLTQNLSESPRDSHSSGGSTTGADSTPPAQRFNPKRKPEVVYSRHQHIGVDGGFVKCNIATPHMLHEHSEVVQAQTSVSESDLFSGSGLNIERETQSQGVEHRAMFLDDFIDGK